MTKLFDAKPFIIAEIGSNFMSFNDAKDSISFANAAGADAVKFQLFDELSLYGKYNGPRESMPGQLPIDWLPKLKEKADACGIEFMCSAFSPELYDVVNPYVLVHKIASSELTYPQTLDKVKSFKKPILLSVGGSSKGDIEQAMKHLRGGPQVVLMYCSSAYPSKRYNLFQMQDLAATFSVPVGFSDHSIDVIYPALSAFKHFGAVAIEKHVNYTHHSTPDSKHSLDSSEFKDMCDVLKGRKDFSNFNPQKEEHHMFLRNNRRLVAITDISKGDSFRYGGNFGSFRTVSEDVHGLSAFCWENLVVSNGAKRDIKSGCGIGPGDF